jgi:hypothetical protein
MQLIAMREFPERDSPGHCDFLFRRADGSFYLEKATGLEPHQVDSLIVEIDLQTVFNWLRHEPEEIKRAIVDGGRVRVQDSCLGSERPRSSIVIEWLTENRWWRLPNLHSGRFWLWSGCPG